MTNILVDVDEFPPIWGFFVLSMCCRVMCQFGLCCQFGLLRLCECFRIHCILHGWRVCTIFIHELRGITFTKERVVLTHGVCS